MLRFVYFFVECLFNKFDGINCRPKLGAKLLNLFFHGWRQVNPAVKNAMHRFFNGSQHFLYCNITVGSRLGTAAFFPADKPISSVFELVECARLDTTASTIRYPSSSLRRAEDKRTTRRATPRRLPSSSEGSR